MALPPRGDKRPPMVVAMTWVNRLTTISLEMVLPAWGGHLLDARWSTRPWLTALGAIIGLSVAMYHLLKIVQQTNGGRDGDA